MRRKADVQAVVADWSNKFDHIWATRKENRIRVLVARYEEIQDLINALYDHAQRETETLRNVDPEAGDVPVSGTEFRAYSRDQQRILREIADEMGQLVSRSQPDLSANKPHLTHTVEGVDLAKALGIITTSHAAAESVPAAPVVNGE
jgi:hypothetical protein